MTGSLLLFQRRIDAAAFYPAPLDPEIRYEVLKDSRIQLQKSNTTLSSSYTVKSWKDL